MLKKIAIITLLIMSAHLQILAQGTYKNITIEPNSQAKVWEKGRKYAIVIGISKYALKNIPDLKYAVDDAKAIADFLENKSIVKYDEVILLTDTNATRINILRALTDIAKKIGPNDTFFMYYSGHGKEEYLIPYDGDREYLPDTCVRWGVDIYAKINKMEAKQKILVIDSCHSGSVTNAQMIAMGKGTLEKTSIDEQLLSTMGQGLFVITSSRDDEVSWENEKISHGYFTYNLVEGLKGSADDRGGRFFGNGDGYVSADELYNYVSYKTNEDVMKDLNKSQHPRKCFQGEGVIFLSKVTDSISEESNLLGMEKELKEKEEELRRLESEEKAITEKRKAEALQLKVAAIEKETREKEKSIKIIKDKIKQSESQAKEIKSSSGLVAYYPFNGNADDESGNGNNLTVHGATLTTDRFGNENSAYYFNGVDDYLLCKNNASLNPSKAITLSAWVFPKTIVSGETGIVNKWKAGGANVYSYCLEIHFGIPEFALCPAGGSGGGFEYSVMNTKNILPVNKWTHLTAVYDGSDMFIYIDGIEIAKNAFSGTIYNSPTDLWIGRSPWSKTFDGIIDDVYIYNRALSESEIKRFYNTEKLKGGLVAYYPFNGNANDESGNGNNGTVNGATITTDRFGNENSAYSFNGNSKIIVNSVGDLSSISVALWVIPFVYENHRNLFSIGGLNYTNKFRFEFHGENWPAQFDAGFGDGNKFAVISVTGFNNIPLNQWTLIAMTHDHLTDENVLYINGKLYKTIKQAVSLFPSFLNIGVGYTDSSERSFKGKIDDIRIYNRALSGPEVRELYDMENK